MFSWVLLVSFDAYHVNLLIFGEDVLYFHLEFQHHSSCSLCSPFYLWGKQVKTAFPGLFCHWEALGGEPEGHREAEAPLLWQWWAGLGASKDIKSKVMPLPLGFSCGSSTWMLRAYGQPMWVLSTIIFLLFSKSVFTLIAYKMIF